MHCRVADTNAKLGCMWKVAWSVPEDSLIQVRGFRVRYQAVGSHVVQYSDVLSSSTFSHYITRLHENTAYDVCVNVITADEVSLTRRLVNNNNNNCSSF